MKEIDIQKMKDIETIVIERNADFYLKPNLLKNDSLDKTIEFLAKKNFLKNKIVMKCVAEDNVDLNLKVILSTKDKGIREVDVNLEVYILNLSKKNNIRIEPFLEIKQQGVKFEHKVAIGAPKEKWIKYLKSRGNDGKQATKLISQAFITG